MKILLVLAFMVLSGCATKGIAVDRASEVAKKGLINSEWFVCRAAPIGSVLDRYGKTDERAREYKDFCFPKTDVNIVSPE